MSSVFYCTYKMTVNLKCWNVTMENMHNQKQTTVDLYIPSSVLWMILKNIKELQEKAVQDKIK